MENKAVNQFIMKKIIQLISLAFLLSGSFQLKAQKEYYSTQEEVIEAAYLTLDRWIESGEFRENIEHRLERNTGENKMSGTYVMDITLRHKGEVVSVNVVESNAAIKLQNYMKDYIKLLKFPFKMPKNKRYKFRYEFKF